MVIAVHLVQILLNLVNIYGNSKSFNMKQKVIYSFADTYIHNNISIYSEYCSLWFGVCEENECFDVFNTFFTDLKKGYGWIANNNCLISGSGCGSVYGKKTKPNDIVTMTFDLNKPSLTFNVNGEDYGEKHFGRNIKTHVKYRMALSFGSYPQKIKLLDYQCSIT